MIIDCFAGGGGASVGIEMALGYPVDIAVNHDPEAIRMHEVNHPNTLHLTEDIFKVDLERYVNGDNVELMWASPDCTSHSKAKGGQPRKSGLRILPWAVYKHAKVINPNVIIMENVEENEMQRNVAIGKAFRFPSVVQRVMPDGAAINGDEYVFTLRSAHEAHMIPQPAFQTSPLIIIGSGTLRLIIVTAFETINIEITHICSDFFKVFDKLTV